MVKCYLETYVFHTPWLMIGASIENFVATELVASEINDLFYWTSKSNAEVDFVVQSDNQIKIVKGRDYN